MRKNFTTKFAAVTLLVAMMGSLAGCGAAEETETTATAETEAVETTAVATTEDPYAGCMTGTTLSIGTDVSFVPFEFPDDNDVYVGFDMDLIAAMSEYLGFTYEMQPMDFTAMLMSVQTSKIDVGIAGITMTDEREETMDFSLPYYDAGIQILVQEDSDITSFSELGDKTLALKDGTASLTYCEENYPDAKIETFSTIDEAYLEVARGSADACVFDAPNMLYYVSQNPDCGCKVVGELEDACQYGILFPTDSANKEYFDAALTKFKEDGTYDSIYEKWFGTN